MMVYFGQRALLFREIAALVLGDAIQPALLHILLDAQMPALEAFRKRVLIHLDAHLSLFLVHLIHRAVQTREVGIVEPGLPVGCGHLSRSHDDAITTLETGQAACSFPGETGPIAVTDPMRPL